MAETHEGRKHLLSDADLGVLRHCFDSRKTLIRGREILNSADHIHVVLDGMVGRHESFRDGRCQLVTLHLPGEICDVDRVFCPELDYGARAMVECIVATIPVGRLRSAIDENAAIRDLFWSSTAYDNTALSRRVSTLGRGTAHERVARFFCDMAERLHVRGQLIEDTIRLGLSQSEMAEYLGLSLVHTNRTLQDLKADGLIESQGPAYTLRDLPRLRALAGGLGKAQRTIDARVAAISSIMLAAAAP